MPRPLEPPPTDALDAARLLLRDARRVLVLTGAGVSAESGVPTFRGAGGLWKEYRAEQLATPEAFARDPRLVWEWYEWRRAIVRRCRPNAAHLALASLAASRDGVRIVTQNVDALHVRAAREAAPGSDAALPVELHGSLFRVRCTECETRAAHDEPVDASDVATLPACARCGALMRPDVVWFGESLDPAVIGAAFDEAARADLCLVIGTSAVVQPAASLATFTREHGGRVVEVNPEPTPLTAIADLSIRAGAADAIPAIVGSPAGAPRGDVAR